MPMYLVERYLAHDDPHDVHADTQRVRDLLPGDAGVRLVWCLLAPHDATVFCLYEAADEAAVSDVNRRGGFPVDRISPVVPLP